MNQTETGNGQPKARVSDAEQIVADLNDAADCLRSAARLIAKRLGASGNGSPAQRPAPTSPEDRITTKQLACIHAIARKAGLDRKRLGTLLEEIAGKDNPAALSRSEASELIDRLQALVD